MATYKKNKNDSLKTLNDSINIGYIFCVSTEINFAAAIPNLTELSLVRLKMNLVDCNEVKVMMMKGHLLSLS